MKLNIKDVPDCGIEINLDSGLTIYVYKSTIDGRFCIELETVLDFEDVRPTRIQHDEDGRPLVKIMLNEAVISNDGYNEVVK